jgi:hypothetical protein
MDIMDTSSALNLQEAIKAINRKLVSYPSNVSSEPWHVEREWLGAAPTSPARAPRLETRTLFDE